MSLIEHHIPDYEWERIEPLMNNDHNASLIRRYASLYYYAQRKKLHEIVTVPPTEYLSNMRIISDIHRFKNLQRIRAVFDSLLSMDGNLVKRATTAAGRFMDYYRTFEFIVEIADFLGLTTNDFIVVPAPLRAAKGQLIEEIEEPGKVTADTLISSSSSQLFRRWFLAHMIVRPSFDYHGRDIMIHHKHLSRCLTNVKREERRVASKMIAFKPYYDLTPSTDLRLLLAAPHVDFAPTSDKDGHYCDLIEMGKVNLITENRHLMKQCVKHRVDILILPEMLIPLRVKKSLQDSLGERNLPRSGNLFPWLTIAGSCHQEHRGVFKSCWFNQSSVLGPLGGELWTHNKVCPSPLASRSSAEDPKIEYENIVGADSVFPVDIPLVGRTLLLICRDYVDVGRPGITGIWPTLFLVPAFSGHLEDFKAIALQNRRVRRAATVIRNSAQAIQFFGENSYRASTFEPSLSDIVHVVSNADRKSLTDKSPIVIPERIPTPGSSFWSDLYLVKL